MSLKDRRLTSFNLVRLYIYKQTNKNKLKTGKSKKVILKREQFIEWFRMSGINVNFF